jgi:hypothetical protein
MAKTREEEQAEPVPDPSLSRRELLIRTGQVALVVGSTQVVATLLVACGDDSAGEGTRECFPLPEGNYYSYYGYTTYCYEVYSRNGYDYGEYTLAPRLFASVSPRYRPSE